MFFGNKLDKKLDEEIDSLTRDNRALERENANLLARIKDLTERIDGEYSKATYSLDWKEMNAFSIERMMENGTPKTVVGYLLTEPVISTDNDNVTYKDVVREWTLYCSHEEHQRLVKQFEQYKKEKYGS
jgi:hypothetical protein